MTVIAGFGFRGDATSESLANAHAKARNSARISEPTAMICAPADKAESACLAAFAADCGLAISPIDAHRLTGIETPTQAPRVIAKRGVGSIAEAVALAASEGAGDLIARRVISDDRMATCALVKV